MNSLPKTVFRIEENVLKTFKKACDVATTQSDITQSDIDQVWRDFESACKNAGHTSTDTALAEVKEHVHSCRCGPEA